MEQKRKLQNELLFFMCLLHCTICTMATYPEICIYLHSKYQCRKAVAKDFKGVDLPVDNCVENSCEDCHTEVATYLIGHDSQLVKPHRFFTKHVPDREGKSATFTCADRGLPCSCQINETKCSGTPAYCQTQPCTKGASCNCKTEKSTTHILHFAEDETELRNPTKLTVLICTQKRETKNDKSRHRHSRRLLQHEDAIFQENELRLTFINPVLILSTTGTLIIRGGGLERILTVPPSKQLPLPAEFMTLSQVVKLTFISEDGKSLQGQLSIVAGSDTCRRFKCLMCREFLMNLDCAPPTIKYAIYCSIIILTTITLLYLKIAIKTIWSIFKAIGTILYQVFRLIRSILRFGLITGSVTGQAVRNQASSFNEFLEARLPPRNPIITKEKALLALVILTMATSPQEITATCNAHHLLKTDFKNCQTSAGKDLEQCEIESNLQITLKSLESEVCLWLRDGRQKNIVSLKIKLHSANCQWHSVRKYFTFPADLHHITQISCPNQAECSWLKHCVHNHKFDALSAESMQYPGINSCFAASENTGCWLVHAKSCLFYRIFFKPKYEKSFEVRQITGKSCKYNIAIRESYNNSLETISLSSIAATKNGRLKFEVLGTFDQDSIFVPEDLILRVGNSKEAYFERAAPVGLPQKQLVGGFQSNETFSKSFIFDPDLPNCIFHEATMVCHMQDSPLEAMIKTKRTAIPLVRNFHAFYIEDGELKSTLLTTAPVVLNMHFKGYNVFVENTVVCPQFKPLGAIKAEGCFSCRTLAQITIQAGSTCSPGLVEVTFEVITLATRAIYLETHTTEIVIQFIAASRCIDDKLCLSSKSSMACLVVNFCLAEPTVLLEQANHTNSMGNSMYDQDSTWFSSVNLNNAFAAMRLFKAAVIAVSILFLLMFVFSTVKTCLHR